MCHGHSVLIRGALLKLQDFSGNLEQSQCPLLATFSGLLSVPEACKHLSKLTQSYAPSLSRSLSPKLLTEASEDMHSTVAQSCTLARQFFPFSGHLAPRRGLTVYEPYLLSPTVLLTGRHKLCAVYREGSRGTVNHP